MIMQNKCHVLVVIMNRMMKENTLEQALMINTRKTRRKTTKLVRKRRRTETKGKLRV